MGKSTSCFKLVTCGGDAADKDDYQVSEIKDSNDKRGWSFRKRSARHRVLNNTVITETPSSANKESSECSSTNCKPLAEPNVVEKIYTTHCSDEKSQLSSLASSQMSQKVVAETESKVDVDVPESVIIIIQVAIRGFLAQRSLLKSKNVVKLQAAVRGHLVRRHAVGTLRCVQAIVKMQALVRARRAKQGNEFYVTKSNVMYTSMEKLLSNKFARQLLESTPKNKPIHVKCNPSKADSAWKWMERWMFVSSKDAAESRKTISMTEQSDEITDRASVSRLKTGSPSEDYLPSADSKPIGNSLMHENGEKETTNDAYNARFLANSTSFLMKDTPEHAPPEQTITYDSKGTSTENNSFQFKKGESDASASLELNFLLQKPKVDDEHGKQTMPRFASDQLETEGKTFLYGSRKLSNPAYIAAESKFEELSSLANSGKSSSLSYQDAVVDSQADTSSVATDTTYRSKELFSSDKAGLFPSGIGGSECVTENSISPALDSPDKLEVGAMENECDAKNLAEGFSSPENNVNLGVEDNVSLAITTPNLPNSNLDQSEIVGDVSGHMIPSVVAGDFKGTSLESEKDASHLVRERGQPVLQDFRSSPEASPRSYITIPESQGTPSSQVSIKPKENKVKKTGSTNRCKIQSVGNKSPANASHDSGSKGSKEQLPKDQQSGKRRNSFGSVKPDQMDQEPRDNSNINSSLPHFMQATESAKAKINANNSPRSSPDVHDQDVHAKKRHSLPGATGRQSSPRIQQAQQSTKGNGIRSHERKWQR